MQQRNIVVRKPWDAHNSQPDSSGKRLKNALKNAQKKLILHLDTDSPFEYNN